MRKIWLIASMLGIMLSTNVMAQTVGTPGTAIPPTEASTPIPSLNKTNNIDTVLSEKVQAKLNQVPSLQGQTVSAASFNQVVKLQGAVQNKAQEEDAIKAAQSVNGVKKVESQLTIKAGE